MLRNVSKNEMSRELKHEVVKDKCKVAVEKTNYKVDEYGFIRDELNEYPELGVSE